MGVRFSDNKACETRFQETLWNGGICCGKCAGKRLKSRWPRKTYLCKSFGREFSLKVGSFMSRSRHSLQVWFLAALNTRLSTTRGRLRLFGKKRSEPHHLRFFQPIGITHRSSKSLRLVTHDNNSTSTRLMSRDSKCLKYIHNNELF